MDYFEQSMDYASQIMDLKTLDLQYMGTKSQVHILHHASSVISMNYNRCPMYHPWNTTAVQALSIVYKLRPIWCPCIASPGFSSPLFTTHSPLIAQNSPLIAQNCLNSSMFLASNRPSPSPDETDVFHPRLYVRVHKLKWYLKNFLRKLNSSLIRTITIMLGGHVR